MHTHIMMMHTHCNSHIVIPIHACVRAHTNTLLKPATWYQVLYTLEVAPPDKAEENFYKCFNKALQDLTHNSDQQLLNQLSG